MKKIILLFCLFLGIQNYSFSHNTNLSNLNERVWLVNNESVRGSFLITKNKEVFIEKTNGEIAHFPIKNIAIADQNYVSLKSSQIAKLNKNNSFNPNFDKHNTHFPFLLMAILLTSSLVAFFIYHKKLVKVAPLILVFLFVSLVSFTSKIIKQFNSITNPLTIDSAFAVYKPSVNTFWDSTYFSVESKGIPAHGMMTGITGWQQQFPIPQCYIGSNAWSIPLNPTIATNPVPVNQYHFLRGAIAIAVNGVAIFNPYTNTGVDAFLDGQLDYWGGHCGRADDYHYHTAPLHLYSTSPLTFPIAYALDGFAVYGTLEPDGSNMKSLDANHGHYASNGVYHYHGTSTAPYMIANMVGKVTEDSTLQIIPQAAAKPIRPSGTPLKGAVITNLVANSNQNGYALTYTLSGLTYLVAYEWNTNGVYTFKYTSPSGVVTTNVYNGFKQCAITTSIESTIDLKRELVIFPNPTSGDFQILFTGNQPSIKINEVAVYDLLGKMLYQEKESNGSIALGMLGKGTYIIKVKSGNVIFNKKVIIN